MSGAAPLREFPPVSVLRPMAGDRDNTEAGLRTVFEQDYPDYEIVLGVASPDDAAVPIARRLMAEYPERSSRLVFTGESPYPNRKVWQLRGLWDAAQHETIVMADSDIFEDRLWTRSQDLFGKRAVERMKNIGIDLQALRESR